MHAALSAFDQFGDVGLVRLREHEGGVPGVRHLHQEVEVFVRFVDPGLPVGVASANGYVGVFVHGHVGIGGDLTDICNVLLQLVQGRKGYSAPIEGDGAYPCPGEIFHRGVGRVDADDLTHLRRVHPDRVVIVEVESAAGGVAGLIVGTEREIAVSDWDRLYFDVISRGGNAAPEFLARCDIHKGDIIKVRVGDVPRQVELLAGLDVAVTVAVGDDELIDHRLGSVEREVPVQGPFLTEGVGAADVHPVIPVGKTRQGADRVVAGSVRVQIR